MNHSQAEAMPQLKKGKLKVSLLKMIGDSRLVALLMVVTLPIFYTLVSAGNIKDADGANLYLRGLDMAAGNWGLRGWYVPIANYWFQDSLVYALGALIIGNHPFLMVVVPAIEWVAVIISALILTQRGLEKRNQTWSIVLVLSILAFPVMRDPITQYITSGYHVPTVFQSILLFLLAHRFLDRGGAFPVTLFLVLGTITVAGDPTAVLIAALPAGAAAVLTEESTQRRRLIVATMALLIVVLGYGLVAVNAAAGGFSTLYDTPPFYVIDASHPTSSTAFRFAPLADIPRNTSFTFQAILGFWGANFFGQPVVQAIPQLIRLPLLAVSFWTIVVAMRRIVTAATRLTSAPFGFLDSTLALGVLAVIGGCLLSNVMIVPAGGRHVLPSVVYAAILTARQAPQFKARAMVSTLAVLGSLMAANAYNLTVHPRLQLYPEAATELAHRLQNQGLRFGYATYWTASPVTVASRNSVRVLALAQENGWLVPRLDETCAAWYPNPLNSRHPFFVIVDSPEMVGSTFRSADCESLFGPPSESITVERFTVNIYR
jgi:hypothetical protein